MQNLTKETIKTLLKPREADSHKGTYGHALLVAGNIGRMGAAAIAARACLRSGVGLLTVNVSTSERFALPTIPEAMLLMRENTEINYDLYTAAGIGPGLGTTIDSEKLLVEILQNFKLPIVLDADALNIIAANKKLFDLIPKGTIITPHVKEFQRLFGNHQNNEERINTAIKIAYEKGWIIVLKGQNTLITANGEAFFNTTGNAGLAKGGSGDALTGIILAFLAQGYKPFDTAKIAVFIHGLAADFALKNQSMESMLISDVIECIGLAFKEIMK
jgi:hydroxyethylthiazole kinase-like uncharacterized protein yjeF